MEDIGKKIFTAIISKIKNAFKLVKNILKLLVKYSLNYFQMWLKGIGKADQKYYLQEKD